MPDIARAARAGAAAARSGAALPVAAALLAGAACALLAPAVVNGDGLGYLRAAIAGERVAGHLAWLPLLRLVATVSGSHDPLALLVPARILCLLSAAIAVAAFAAAASHLAGRHAAAVAALGMAGSFGLLEAGSDVEAYAPALAAMCIALWCAARRALGGQAAWSILSACAAAAAALLHIENVLFIPVIALCTASRRRTRRAQMAGASATLAIGGAIVIAGYAVSAHARGDGLIATLRWIRGASHGLHYPLRATQPLLAVYGAARTLVRAPYVYEAGWPRTIAQTLVGLAACAAMVFLALRPGRPRTLGALVALAWAVPYAAVGTLFFASDDERWLFLLPLGWLLCGAGAATSMRATRAGLALGAVLLVLSIALGLPPARDASRRIRADAATALFGAGDLVVSPGHGWDEYVGFYRPLALERFPLIYFCGQLGSADQMDAELRARIERVRSLGHRVWFLRADDSESSEGWKDLAWFGVRPDGIDGLVGGRRVGVAAGVERIDAVGRR